MPLYAICTKDALTKAILGKDPSLSEEQMKVIDTFFMYGYNLKDNDTDAIRINTGAMLYNRVCFMDLLIKLENYLLTAEISPSNLSVYFGLYPVNANHLGPVLELLNSRDFLSVKIVKRSGSRYVLKLSVNNDDKAVVFTILYTVLVFLRLLSREEEFLVSSDDPLERIWEVSNYILKDGGTKFYKDSGLSIGFRGNYNHILICPDAFSNGSFVNKDVEFVRNNCTLSSETFMDILDPNNVVDIFRKPDSTTYYLKLFGSSDLSLFAARNTKIIYALLFSYYKKKKGKNK